MMNAAMPCRCSATHLPHSFPHRWPEGCLWLQIADALPLLLPLLSLL